MTETETLPDGAFSLLQSRSVCLLEADAAAYLRRAVQTLRRLNIPSAGPTPAPRLKRDRYFDLKSLMAWAAEHGSVRETRTRTAQSHFTKYPRWQATDDTWRAATTHPHFSIWRGVVARCYREDDKDFPGYGGRGIALEPEWETDPGAFCVYLDSLGARNGRTLDRKNNDLGYTRRNLQWATALQQAANRRAPGWLERRDLDCDCDYDCRSVHGGCPLEELPWQAARLALSVRS